KESGTTPRFSLPVDCPPADARAARTHIFRPGGPMPERQERYRFDGRATRTLRLPGVAAPLEAILPMLDIPLHARPWPRARYIVKAAQKGTRSLQRNWDYCRSPYLVSHSRPPAHIYSAEYERSRL